jgi:hypothetical protein
MSRTRDSRLQSDHVNEPDFDEKIAEGENSISDSGGGTRTKENGNRKSASECWARPASPIGLYSTRLRGCHRAPQIPEVSGCRVSAHAGNDPIAREIRDPLPEALDPASLPLARK